jgi:uncharacterized protein (DUF58 family)
VIRKLKVKRATRKAPDVHGTGAFLSPEEMHKLSRLVMMSRYVVEGNLAGAHRSPLRGQSSEFADHKAYGVGDDPKNIDWKVLGRTDKYYVKRFEDETNLRVYIALDRSASMAYGSGSTTKYDYACHLAAALAYVVVKARDSVGLYLYSDHVDLAMEARNSFRHLNDMMTRLQTFEPDSKTNIAEALHHIAGSVRHRALIIVISDLLGDEGAIEHALAHFRKRNHDVIVLQVLDPMELDLAFKNPCDFEDLETKARVSVNPRALRKSYQDVFRAFIDQYRQTCAGMKIDYRIARTDQPFEDFVRAYMTERQRLSR